MEALTLHYWFPLYAFLRRKGLKAETAEDMTQEFFVQRILSRKIFRGTDPSRGKFRSWLLTSLQNFVHNEWDKEVWAWCFAPTRPTSVVPSPSS